MTWLRLVRRLLLVSPALLIALSCGANAEPLPQATVSPTAEPSATTDTPSPSPSPPPSPLLSENSRLVFLRHPIDTYQPRGELWVSDSDGSNARRLSPDGATAAYAGKIRGKAGNVIVYFVTQDSETDRSVWRVDADSGGAQLIFSYRAPPTFLYAAVSPDGGHIAFVESASLSLLDLASGGTRLLFASGDWDACRGGDIIECHGDVGPQWSPDGRLLLVTHAVYEGGWVQVIDPFVDPPTAFIAGAREVPSSGFWSPGSDALCAMGVYGGNSGLYLVEEPEWQPRNRFPEYEDWTMNPEGRSVADCVWLDESEVAYVTFSQTPSRAAEIDVLDTRTDDWRVVALFEEIGTCCSGRLTGVDGGRSVIAQFTEYLGSNTPHWARPQLVNIDTGESQFILEADDFVIAAFTR